MEKFKICAKWRAGFLVGVLGVLLFTSKAFAFGGGQSAPEGGEAPNMLVTMFPFILMFVIL